MNTSRLTGRRAPHVCPSCALAFVHAELGVPKGDGWHVLLLCASCGWSGEALLDDAALEEFDRELDEDRARIELDLERLTQHNMRDYYERFAAALASDAILPEDF